MQIARVTKMLKNVTVHQGRINVPRGPRHIFTAGPWPSLHVHQNEKVRRTEQPFSTYTGGTCLRQQSTNEIPV